MRKRTFKLFFSNSNVDKRTRDCIKDLFTQEKSKIVKYVVDKCVARLKIKKTFDGSVSNPIYQLIDWLYHNAGNITVDELIEEDDMTKFKREIERNVHLPPLSYKMKRGDLHDSLSHIHTSEKVNSLLLIAAEMDETKWFVIGASEEIIFNPENIFK